MSIFAEPLYANDDGTYEIIYNGYPYCVNEKDTSEIWTALKEWINVNGIKISVRPEKTIKEQSEILQYQLELFDLKSIRSIRAILSGKYTDDDIKKLQEHEEEVKSLRNQLKIQ